LLSKLILNKIQAWVAHIGRKNLSEMLTLDYLHYYYYIKFPISITILSCNVVETLLKNLKQTAAIRARNAMKSWNLK
jgi:uncharacterized protein YybS (DUF2232 family)